MPTITSSKFSFIRFEPVNYNLLAFKKFDEAFQFMVDGYYPSDYQIQLYVADKLGYVGTAFSFPVFAQLLSYKMLLPRELFRPKLFLQSITVDGVQTIYEQYMTYPEMKELVLEDFGWQVTNENTFTIKTPSVIVIIFSSLGTNNLPVTVTLNSYWGSGYVKAPGETIGLIFPPGSCFFYYLRDQTGELMGKTNMFKVLASDKYTSLLSYCNNEDAFEFYYNGTEMNIVRLPFYCSRPLWPEKKTGYNYSNGRHKLLSAFVEETYSLRTDHMTAELHRYFKIALAHDQIYIDCPHMIETPQQIIDMDSYNPTWDDDQDLQAATAQCIVTVASFGYRNDNCDEPI